jgi:hypothetical protein
MEPFARTIDAARKYVVSTTLNHVDWNAQLLRGDLATAVQQLKREPGRGLFVGGLKVPLPRRLKPTQKLFRIHRLAIFGVREAESYRFQEALPFGQAISPVGQTGYAARLTVLGGHDRLAQTNLRSGLPLLVLLSDMPLFLSWIRVG